MAERIAALADESRLRLLVRLREGPANVSVLTGELGIAQASVSKQLGVLRRVGLVEVERVGTQAIYSVKDGSVFEMCRLACAGVERELREQQDVLAAAARNGKRRSS